MSKLFKLIIGVLFSAPILLWIIFMFISPFIQVKNSSNQLYGIQDLYPGPFGHFVLVLILIGATFGIILGILTFMGKGLPTNRKNLWGLLLVLGNVFVLPFYWYNILWKENNKGK